MKCAVSKKDYKGTMIDHCLHSIWQVIAALLVVGVSCFYFDQKRRKRRLPFKGIPYVLPKPHWLFGHLPLLGKDVVQGQRALAIDYAGSELGISTFYVFNTPTISFLDAEINREILRSTSDRKGNPGVTRHFRRLMGEHSIIMKNGKEWKASRDIIHRAFREVSMESLRKITLEAALERRQELIDIAKRQGGKWNTTLLFICRNLVMAVACEACFRHTLQTFTDGEGQEESTIVDNLNWLQQDVTNRCYREQWNPFAQLYSLPTPRNRGHHRIARSLRRTTKKMVRERRLELQRHPEKYCGNLLDSVLKGSNALGDVSDDFISDWIVTVLFGFEATALALAYSMYSLVRYPKYSEDCSKEATTFFTNDKGSSSSFRSRLPMTSACAFEAIRLFPPTLLTARNLHKDFELRVEGKKYTLPEGSRVCCSIYCIHRSEKNFVQAENFRPDRWVCNHGEGWKERCSSESSKVHQIAPGDHRNHLSFSYGARNCVGRAYAEELLPLLAALLVQTFEFELIDDSEPVLERFGTSIAPRGGIGVIVNVK